MKREYTEQPKNKSRFVVSLALDGYRIAQNCAGVGVYFFPPPRPQRRIWISQNFVTLIFIRSLKKWLHAQTNKLRPQFILVGRGHPGVAQRVGRGIALLFHDRSTRKGWVVSSTPRPHFTAEKDPVSTLQETGWAPGPVWTDGKYCPHRDSIPDRPARSQSLYRLSHRVHVALEVVRTKLYTYPL